MAETLAFTRDKNQIATPSHIVEFLSELLEIENKRVLDPTAGHGNMLQFASDKCGIELDEKPYKMLCERFPDGDFVNASVFDCEEWIKERHPKAVLMNPPFNADKSKGLEFVRFVADAVCDGRLAAIVPTRCAACGSKLIDSIKAELLKRHTLEYVFTFSNDLFHPAAAASVVCLVFTLGVPHGETETFFAELKDDGFVKDRKGRSDKDGRWQGVKETWKQLCKEKPTHKMMNSDGQIPCSVKMVDASMSWTPSQCIEIDEEALIPTEDDFRNTVRDYMDWKRKTVGDEAFFAEYSHLISKEDRAKQIRNKIASLQDELFRLTGEIA